MKVIDEINEQHTKRSPVVLTIGFFDGVHLGHQKIFNKINELKGENGQSVVLTFQNHPQTVINPSKTTPLIDPLNQRVHKLQEQGTNLLALLPFTEDLKSTSCDEFLMNLHEHIPFDHLVLGPDSTIGHKKQGNVELIKLLSKKYSFEFHQVNFEMSDNQRISSSRIREHIKAGDFEQASKLLGQPYTLLCPIIAGEQIGQIMGFPTINLEVSELALPPFGVYKMFVHANDKKHLAIANLGLAPTVHERQDPVLEVHLLEDSINFDSDELEVEFDSYIRGEQKFSSLDELKKQIAKDIEYIKT